MRKYALTSPNEIPLHPLYEWTNVAPAKSGYYWFSAQGTTVISPVELFKECEEGFEHLGIWLVATTEGDVIPVEKMQGLWWTEPLTRPPTDALRQSIEDKRSLIQVVSDQRKAT